MLHTAPLPPAQLWISNGMFLDFVCELDRVPSGSFLFNRVLSCLPSDQTIATLGSRDSRHQPPSRDLRFSQLPSQVELHRKFSWSLLSTLACFPFQHCALNLALKMNESMTRLRHSKKHLAKGNNFVNHLLTHFISCAQQKHLMVPEINVCQSSPAKCNLLNH